MSDAAVLRPALRRASTADSANVLAWRNDPWIVSLSTSQKPVTPADHEAWFQRVLDPRRHLLFVVEVEGRGVGTVRVDREDDPTRSTITIYLLREFTGRGLGPPAIDAGSRAAFEAWPDLRVVVAHIRSDNAPSRRGFARAGFVEDPALDAPPDHVSFVCARG